jgi:hypothetical protein
MGFKPAKKLGEKEFQAQVLQLAALCGWRLVYHTFDSKRSQEGFPDLVLIKGNVLLVAELKVGDNEPTAAQQAWLDGFGRVGALVYVWRPTDAHWKEIQRVLGA